MRETSYGLRSEASRIGLRRLLAVVSSIFLVFVSAFEMGHLASERKAPAEVRSPAELSVASVRAGIPVKLSSVPPIAALPVPGPVFHTHLPSVVTAAPVTQLAPTSVEHAPVIVTPAPTSTPTPTPTSANGGSPAASAPQPTHKASPPAGGHNGGGGGGSFDSSG